MRRKIQMTMVFARLSMVLTLALKSSLGIAGSLMYYCSDPGTFESHARGYTVEIYKPSSEAASDLPISLRSNPAPGQNNFVGNAQARLETTEPRLNPALGKAPGFPSFEIPYRKASFYYRSYTNEEGPTKQLVAQVYFEAHRKPGDTQDRTTLKAYVHTLEYGGSQELLCNMLKD